LAFWPPSFRASNAWLPDPPSSSHPSCWTCCFGWGALLARQLIEQASKWLASAGDEWSDSEQWTLLQDSADRGGGFNLLSLLSTVPVGLPSLMAGRMPVQAPWSTVESSS
jgi:hypothetical protein